MSSLAASASAATPRLFSTTLAVFHLFPLHSPLTLFVLDAPFGRFASSSASRWTVDGNVGWCIMEITAPLTFLLTLRYTDHPPMSAPALILSGLYLTHYLHRAIISPLVLSPRRSRQHVVVTLAAVVFNLLNAYNLAIGLTYYPATSLPSWRFCIGVTGWLLGFAGNIYHDEVLNDLRREPARRLVSTATPDEAEDRKVSTAKGRYSIPRAGLFRYVSFPNYLCEWIEWLSFALAAAPSPLISLSHAPTLFGWSPRTLLHPAWMFLLAEITSMLPRATRGHRWYRDTFGDRFPASRRVVLPWLF